MMLRHLRLDALTYGIQKRPPIFSEAFLLFVSGYLLFPLAGSWGTGGVMGLPAGGVAVSSARRSFVSDIAVAAALAQLADTTKKAIKNNVAYRLDDLPEAERHLLTAYAKLEEFGEKWLPKDPPRIYGEDQSSKLYQVAEISTEIADKRQEEEEQKLDRKKKATKAQTEDRIRGLINEARGRGRA